MALINDTLYPTPLPLIRKLCAVLSGKAHGRLVLDPASGDARILKSISEMFWNGHPPQLYACELEPTLAQLTEAQGFPVMHDNFLEYETPLRFDYIIANPPFSLAARFILHAWELLANGGTVVMILPKSILKRADSHEYLAGQLLDEYGHIEDLGRPFAKGAERSTDEECILLTLVKKVETLGGIEFDVENEHSAPRLDDDEKGLMPSGFLHQLLADYNAAINLFAEYHRLHKQLARVTGRFENHLHRNSRHDDTLLKAAQATGDPQTSFNQFYQLLTEAGWGLIFDLPAFQDILTSRARKEVDEFRHTRQQVDLTERNVQAMITALNAQSDRLLKACIQDAFDNMTRWHWENRIKVDLSGTVHHEGWKSNCDYLVAPRVVLPGCVRQSGRGLTLNYGNTRTELDDIDRAICLVLNLPFKGVRRITQAIEEQTNGVPGPSLCYSRFFKIRYYGKGTAHLYWLHTNEWQEFNYAAARMKGWLPSKVKAKHIKVKKAKVKPDYRKRDWRTRDEWTNEAYTIVLDVPQLEDRNGDPDAESALTVLP